MEKHRILDKREFENLFNHCFNDLMHFVNSYLQDTEVSKDIVHDAFLTLWNNRYHLDTSWSLKSYLYTLSRNYALNYLRHQRIVVEKQHLLQQDMEDMREEMEEYENTLARLRGKIEQLPEMQRMVLQRCLLEEKMYKEVAAEFNISVNTVKTHLRRAIAFLRQEMRQNMIMMFILGAKRL